MMIQQIISLEIKADATTMLPSTFMYTLHTRIHIERTD